MMVTAARALCAELEVRPWDEVAIAQAVDAGTAALLAVASHVSPMPDAPGTWWVGASSYEALGGERRLAESLLAIARRWHPGARVAIAGSCVAAFAGTWDGRGLDFQGRETGKGNRETERRDAGNGTAGVARSGRPARGPGSEPGHPTTPAGLTTRASNADRSSNPQSPIPNPGSSNPQSPIPNPGSSNPLLIPPGADAEYLSAAPLALIPMDEEIREALWALGMRTAGALARLETGEVERRWGNDGLAAWRLARGEDARRPVLADPERPRTVSAELAVPAETMEPALFLVRSALERLVPPLVADGRSAAAVAVTLTLDTARTALPTGARAHTVTREVRLPRPVARVKPLFDHCQGLLDRWPLEAPLCGVEVAIVATAPASGEQGDLLDATWRDPGAAEAALARIRSALGAGTVVRAEPGESHAPERTAVWVDSGSVTSNSGKRERGNGKRNDGNREAGSGGVGRAVPDTVRGTAVSTPDSRFPFLDRAESRLSLSGEPDSQSPIPASLRLLEIPESVEVECADGTPCAVWWQGARLTIERALGPERLSGEWWTVDPYARDYWRCGGNEGELLVYADARDGGWYVQGWYD
jgi:protein ImuB